MSLTWLFGLFFFILKEQEVSSSDHDFCRQFGKEPKRQLGTNNYVIDFLEDLPFAFAISQCTSQTVTMGKWYKYTCSPSFNSSNQMWTMTKTEYNDPKCISTGKIIDVWTNVNLKEGNLKYFECDGGNTYTEIQISNHKECENTVNIYGGLGACVNGKDGFLQTEMYCDNTEAWFQIFVNTDMFNFNENDTLNFTEMSSTEVFYNATEPEPSSTEYYPSTTYYYNKTSFPQSTEMNMMCTADLFCDRWEFAKNRCKFFTGQLNHKLYGKMSSCVTTPGTTQVESASPGIWTWNWTVVFGFIFLLCLEN